jgi:hypothetical protein
MNAAASLPCCFRLSSRAAALELRAQNCQNSVPLKTADRPKRSRQHNFALHPLLPHRQFCHSTPVFCAKTCGADIPVCFLTGTYTCRTQPPIFVPQHSRARMSIIRRPPLPDHRSQARHSQSVTSTRTMQREPIFVPKVPGPPPIHSGAKNTKTRPRTWHLKPGTYNLRLWTWDLGLRSYCRIDSSHLRMTAL